MKKVFSFVILTLFICALAGCVYTPPVEGAINGVVITSVENDRSVKVEETLQLSATVYPLTALQTVTWDSSNKDVAVVDENGVVTGVSKGHVEIYAISTADINVKQSFALIIEEKEKVVVEPTSVLIEVPGNVTTIKANETITLTAVVSPAEATQKVDWTSSDSSVASVSRGRVNALKEGTVTITATVRGYEALSASVTFTVEKAAGPAQTKDWANMAYASHTEYLDSVDGTALKIKGVVTHVAPVKDNAVNYFIQNGTEGYYVYAQNSGAFPVELGKVYEVGGFKKYYRGLNEIVDVEFFQELDENITYTVNKLDGINASDLAATQAFHASVVSGSATLVSASVNDSKAYSFTASVNGYDTTLRVDPSYMTAEEFEAINKVLKAAVVGASFEFNGLMTAFGYGAAAPQIQIAKASDLKFTEISDEDYLVAASKKIVISTSLGFAVESIELPTTIEGFEDVKLTWVSSSALIDPATGKVTHEASDTTVTLTAKLSINTTEYEVSYEVVVKAADNATYQVLAAFDCEDALAPNSWGNSESKGGYAEGTVELGTPKATWLLRNALIAAATNDIYDGTLGIRAKAGKSADETGRIEIKKDDEYNIVEFAAAVYGNDASGIQIKIEYSTDSGETWVASEEVLTINTKTLETYRINLPEGVKRVALVIVENTGNRVNIDNIKLMK